MLTIMLCISKANFYLASYLATSMLPATLARKKNDFVVLQNRDVSQKYCSAKIILIIKESTLHYKTGASFPKALQLKVHQVQLPL